MQGAVFGRNGQPSASPPHRAGGPRQHTPPTPTYRPPLSHRRRTGTLNGIPVVSTTTDLCQSLAGSPTPCPLQAGPVKSSTTGTMPSDLPAGTFKGTIKWTDQNGEPILCIEVDVELSGQAAAESVVPPPFVAAAVDRAAMA